MRMSGDPLMNFIELTGADPDIAERYLQAYGYSSELAVAAFYDSGGAPNPPGAQPRANVAQAGARSTRSQTGGGAGQSGSSGAGGANSRPVASSSSAQNVYPSTGAGAGGRGSGRPSSPVMIDDDSPFSDFDGVRAADAHKTERLIDYHHPTAAYTGPTVSMMAMADGKGGGRKKDKSKAPSGLQLLAPPSHLLEIGTFGEVLNRAKAERKWLLCNVQLRDDFTCLELNRSVWRDEAVEDMIKSSFMLWQVDMALELPSAAVSSSDTPVKLGLHASEFMRAYRIHPGKGLVAKGAVIDGTRVPGVVADTAASQAFAGCIMPHDEHVAFPVIALIDPRTREMVWLHRGPISAKTMARRLANVMVDCDWDDTRKPMRLSVTHGSGHLLDSSSLVDVTAQHKPLWGAGVGSIDPVAAVKLAEANSKTAAAAAGSSAGPVPSFKGIFASGLPASSSSGAAAGSGTAVPAGAGHKRGRPEADDVIYIDDSMDAGSAGAGASKRSRPVDLVSPDVVALDDSRDQGTRSGGHNGSSTDHVHIDDDEEDEDYGFVFEDDSDGDGEVVTESKSGGKATSGGGSAPAGAGGRSGTGAAGRAGDGAGATGAGTKRDRADDDDHDMGAGAGSSGAASKHARTGDGPPGHGLAGAGASSSAAGRGPGAGSSGTGAAGGYSSGAASAGGSHAAGGSAGGTNRPGGLAQPQPRPASAAPSANPPAAPVVSSDPFGPMVPLVAGADGFAAQVGGGVALRQGSLDSTTAQLMGGMRLASPSRAADGAGAKATGTTSGGGAIDGLGAGHGLMCTLPPEPAAGAGAAAAAGVVRVQLRLHDGRRVIRRLRSSDPVAALYVLAAHELAARHSIASAYDAVLSGYRGTSGQPPAFEAFPGRTGGLARQDTWDLARAGVGPGAANVNGSLSLASLAHSTLGEAGLASTVVTVVPVGK